MITPRRISAPAGLLGLTPAAFSEQSLRRMQGVNPALAGLMKEVERRALDQGIKIEVSEGLRDRGRQAELVSQGKSKTLNSRHLTGNALDIHIRNPDGSANWDFEAYRPVAEIAKQLAAEKGIPNLVWGGDWKTLRDGVHFELRNADYAAPQGAKGRDMMRGGAGQASMIGQAGGDTLSPAAEPEKRRGLLGFLGDEDRRARLAIALEGMTLNPNTALVGTLQEGIKGRREDKRINATAQWLKSRGRDDLAEAMAAGGLSPNDAVRIAMTPEPQAEQTALMQNVQWLMSQGIPMDRALELARGGTTVNVGGEGPQPQLVGTGGLVAIPDPSQPSGFRTEVLPGSQLAMEREKAAREVAADTLRALLGAEKTGLYKSEVVRAAEEAIAMMGRKGPLDILPEAGIVGERLGRAGINQEAVNLKNALSTVKSGIAFDRLQVMRDMSATGGALGAVTAPELELLMSSLGSLSQDLAPEILKKNLQNIISIMSKIEADPVAAAAYRGQAAPSAPAPQGQRRLKFNPATGELE